MASEPRTVADIPRTAWAWAVLQVAATLVGVMFFDRGILKVISPVFTAISVVLFVQARRWIWWLSIVISTVAMLQSVLVRTWSPAVRIYVAAYWVTSFCLLITPSVRRHFFYPTGSPFRGRSRWNDGAIEPATRREEGSDGQG
jgi:hypothetical protein